MTRGHDALLSEALALHQANAFDEAESRYRDVLRMVPDHPVALQLLGALVEQRGDARAGIALMQRALSLDPNQSHVHVNLGNAFSKLGQPNDALGHYARAIALTPDFADAYFCQGNLLSGLQRFEEALASYDRAVALKPAFADAFVNRGNVLKELRRYDEALESYRRVLALAPQRAEAWHNQGNVYDETGAPEKALACYRRAAALDPSYTRALSAALNAQQHLCDWSDLAANTQAVLQAVDQGRRVSTPFMLLATPATPAQQLRAAETYAAALYPAAASPVWRGQSYRHRRVRVGYFSADLHNHAVGHLIAGLIQNHDRAHFEVIGFSWGAPGASAMRARLENAFDEFIDVHLMSDRHAAELAAWREIDIAVDLMGFTRNARPGIFANRCAPVQASYLGYPGTMGAAYIDYLVADPHLIPADQRAFYRERVVYLPDSYQANDNKRGLGAAPATRRELGLPENAFVFCGFNNNFKITPDVFDIWMRLLAAVPESVLWLFEGNAAAPDALRREAERRGVAASRLIFAPRVALDVHLARHVHADLFLDTFHYNGHTTTSDALWTGVPVITWPSATFAGRVSASLLSAIGLDELVTATPQAYEALALALARDPARLSALKTKLTANRDRTPLFDTVGFTRHLETAYRAMWGFAQRGLPPADIIVPVENQ